MIGTIGSSAVRRDERWVIRRCGLKSTVFRRNPTLGSARLLHVASRSNGLLLSLADISSLALVATEHTVSVSLYMNALSLTRRRQRPDRHGSHCSTRRMLAYRGPADLCWVSYGRSSALRLLRPLGEKHRMPRCTQQPRLSLFHRSLRGCSRYWASNQSGARQSFRRVFDLTTVAPSQMPGSPDLTVPVVLLIASPELRVFQTPSRNWSKESHSFNAADRRLHSAHEPHGFLSPPYAH